MKATALTDKKDTRDAISAISAREITADVMCRARALLLALCAATVLASPLESDDYHKAAKSSGRSLKQDAELDPSYWVRDAQAAIEAKRANVVDGRRARNVVMFLGDGMSVPTLTAARTLLGQRRGLAGEETSLAFEQFPTTGLAKTYCVDAQIADSACSATAYLCGSKANIGTIGVSARVARGDCSAALQDDHQVESIAAWALQDGRDAGIVTTTRVTHASPAGAYAHTSQRNWESSADSSADCGAAAGDAVQEDIALQLIHSYPGKQFKVILGGGRREFLPNTTVDEEGTRGRRTDWRDLIEEWREDKRARNASYQYVWHRDGLLAAADDLPEYLLGLFEGSHMQYHMEANETTEPTLAELTEVAIRSLSRNEQGFFLFVEGGRIDHAHHENLAQLALDETIELAAAVQRATELLDEQDSLVVVTSDHAHVMALNGYSHRGNDIIGPSDDLGDDGVPYMTLSYTNGPGYRAQQDGLREDLTQYDYHDTRFVFPAMVPLSSETHGGDDVAVFAWGAQHGMFSGMFEQSHVPHRMAYAACVGPGEHACRAAGGALRAAPPAAAALLALALYAAAGW